MIRLGFEERNPIDDTPNRITLKGKSIALNDENIITLNDAERQKGAFDDNIIEIVTPIEDMTLVGENEINKAARQILKANSLLKEAIKSNGHLDIWYLRPGDVIIYGEEKFVIMEAQHNMLTRTSNIHLLSLQSGIDNIFRSIDEKAVAKVDIKTENLKEQIITENLNFFGEITITASVNIITNTVSGENIILGGNANRISLGASAKTIGINKSNVLIERGDE
jgi:hypothetical protein